jgi:hypothetical protein
MKSITPPIYELKPTGLKDIILVSQHAKDPIAMAAFNFTSASNAKPSYSL